MTHEKTQRWLISYESSLALLAGGKRTIEINEHPVAWLNAVAPRDGLALLFALKLHPEDPVLGEES